MAVIELSAEVSLASAPSSLLSAAVMELPLATILLSAYPSLVDRSSRSAAAIKLAFAVTLASIASTVD